MNNRYFQRKFLKFLKSSRNSIKNDYLNKISHSKNCHLILKKSNIKYFISKIVIIHEKIDLADEIVNKMNEEVK